MAKKKNKFPSRKQWCELYDTALEIRNLKPWTFLKPTHVVTVQLATRKEPLFFCTIDSKEQPNGIICCPDIEALQQYYIWLNRQETTGFNIEAEQAGLVTSFVDRAVLPKESYERIKDLGYKFRGKGNWILFQSQEQGFAPTELTREEVILLSEGLNHYLEAITTMLKYQLRVDFRESKTLYHRFDKGSNQWVTTSADLKLPEMDHISLTIKDEALMQELHQVSKTDRLVEIDMNYTSFTKEFRGTTYYPKIATILDHKSSILLSNYELPFTEKKEKEAYSLTSFFVKYLKANLLPNTVYVRNNDVYWYLKPLCDELNIRLNMVNTLEKTDELLAAKKTLSYQE